MRKTVLSRRPFRSAKWQSLTLACDAACLPALIWAWLAFVNAVPELVCVCVCVRAPLCVLFCSRNQTFLRWKCCFSLHHVCLWLSMFTAIILSSRHHFLSSFAAWFRLRLFADVWHFPSELSVVLFGWSGISAQVWTWFKCSVLKSSLLLEMCEQSLFKLTLAW